MGSGGLGVPGVLEIRDSRRLEVWGFERPGFEVNEFRGTKVPEYFVIKIFISVSSPIKFLKPVPALISGLLSL